MVQKDTRDQSTEQQQPMRTFQQNVDMSMRTSEGAKLFVCCVKPQEQ